MEAFQENSDARNIVEFKDLQVILGNSTILKDINACIPQGSSTAIIGPNGAGKTTLLLTLLGHVPFKGAFSVNENKGLESIEVGYVPQRLSFDRGMPITVTDFLCMGRQKMPLWLGVRKSLRENALQLLAAVEAEHLQRQQLGLLSGGELQRVLLALALQQDPELLILDEPAAGVDIQGEQVFCELLEKLRRERGFTQLMVSHDLSTVTHHATHVICLNKTVIAEGKPKEVLTPDTLMTLFGLHMGLVDSSAMPSGSGSCAASCCHKENGDDNA